MMRICREKPSCVSNRHTKIKGWLTAAQALMPDVTLMNPTRLRRAMHQKKHVRCEMGSWRRSGCDFEPELRPHAEINHAHDHKLGLSRKRTRVGSQTTSTKSLPFGNTYASAGAIKFAYATLVECGHAGHNAKLGQNDTERTPPPSVLMFRLTHPFTVRSARRRGAVRGSQSSWQCTG